MDNLSKVIEAEAEKLYVIPKDKSEFSLAAGIQRSKRATFTAGCNFMAGHLEGFAEWLDRNAFTRVEPGEWSSDKLLDYSQFTTSQLIEKYFNELNSKG